MAYATLVSLAQTIDHILDHNQYSLSLQQKKHIISIHEYIIFLQAFLEYSSEKSEDSLEGRIGDAANLAEDTIENLMSAKTPYHLGRSWRRRLFDWTFGLSRVMVKRQQEKEVEKLGWMMKKVTEELDSIAGEVMSVKNSLQIKDALTGDCFSAAAPSSRLATSVNNVMIDSNDDLLAIKERLCGGSSKLQVIPIVGMGGIGKTTLARNCYDDKLIVEHFQIRVWITVSQAYRKLEVLSEILLSMKEFVQEGSSKFLKKKKERSRKKSTTDKVYQTLKGRSYLIVMDDVWSTNVWDDLKRIFPDDNTRSRVMLTTRESDVAAYADSSSPLHEMRLMDALQSWNLLRQKVFSHEDCPPELEDIGQEIARNCRGLPLAIVVIAGVLSGVSKTRASWRETAENSSSAVTANNGLVERILSLSYTNLPHHLRPCFLYMGGFPEDHEIRVSRLVKLWVAEGFLKHPDGSKTYEERAEEYLEDLVKRSLVLANKRKSNGKIKICGLHDLVRDMCIRKALEKRFHVHVGSGYVLPKTIKNQRRLSLFYDNLNCFRNVSNSSVRTILYFQEMPTSRGSFGHFRLLRVLYLLNSTRGKYLRIDPPPEIFELAHLKFLGLYHCSNVPDAISNLQNLQTFIVCSSYVSLSLPRTIWKMPQLRHIVCRYLECPYLDDIDDPSRTCIEVLTNLQTFSLVECLECTEQMMRRFPNLKKLSLCYTSVLCDKDYELENLVLLHRLEKLKLEFRHRHLFQGPLFFQGKLNPVFPRMLRKLNLIGWQFPWNNMTVFGSLPNLEVLKMRDHEGQGSKWETSEGEFPCLKYMFIDSPDLEHWITESTHFPSLKSLVLHGFQYLSEIPDGIGDIPTLELIEVKGQNESLKNSAIRIQEEQKTYGNDALQVRCLN